jgi:hypothetical protein
MGELLLSFLFPFFLMLWTGCPHLGVELQKELLMKVAWVSCSFPFLFYFPFFASPCCGKGARTWEANSRKSC